MKQDKFSPVNLICYACGCIPVIWIALLFAPYLDDGLIGLIKNAGAACANPFHIMLCRDSPSCPYFSTDLRVGFGGISLE